MGEVSPDTAAYWLRSDATNAEFRPLVDVLSEVLAVRLSGRSVEQRAELAEHILPRVVSSLGRIAEEFRQDGLEPPFELYSDERTNYLRAAHTRAGQFLNQLGLLAWKEFEGFCAGILQKMGGNSYCCGRPGDGCVDFVGKDIRFFGDPGPTPAGARVLVLGQAKKYAKDNLVTESELREFVGGAVGRVSNPQDSSFRGGILAPVVFAFWTTSEFHPSAKRYARAVGLWYLSGLGISQLAIRLGIDDPKAHLGPTFL